MTDKQIALTSLFVDIVICIFTIGTFAITVFCG